MLLRSNQLLKLPLLYAYVLKFTISFQLQLNYKLVTKSKAESAFQYFINLRSERGKVAVNCQSLKRGRHNRGGAAEHYQRFRAGPYYFEKAAVELLKVMYYFKQNNRRDKRTRK